MIKTNEKGITLVALIIIIIILIILTGIGVNYGSSVVETSRFTEFKTELKTIQARVNELNEADELEIGNALTSEQNEFIDANTNNVVTDIIYNGKTETLEKQAIKEGFRYLESADIEEDLMLEGITRSYLINIEYRYVICYEGFTYKGTTYYMSEQMEDSIYNVQYQNKNPSTGSFEVETAVIEKNTKWKIEISNINYEGNISNWTVKYKLEDNSYWDTTDNLTFYVKKAGTYIINVVHGNEVDLGTQETVASLLVDAEDINNNPSEYYGKTVNYSANDITDWKIFYADSDNIFLITSDYLPIEKVPTLETGMTTTGTYQAYWDSVPTEQTVTSLNSSFMFTGFSDYSTNDNAKCVSTLLNTSNWSGFVNSTYADYCIGSPTLEMWVASWNNNYPSDLLYCNNPSSWGYYIGTSSSPTTYNISLNSYTGYSNTLYYPHTVGYNNCSGYWLASPSACRKGTIMSLHCEDKLTFYDYNETTISVRPLVRLQYGVNLTTENAGTCDFGLSQ